MGILMIKIIVFFNGKPPYLTEIAEHLDYLRLEYPDKTKIDLPVQSHIYPGREIMEEKFYVSDRDISNRELFNAIDDLF